MANFLLTKDRHGHPIQTLSPTRGRTKDEVKTFIKENMGRDKA